MPVAAPARSCLARSSPFANPYSSICSTWYRHFLKPPFAGRKSSCRCSNQFLPVELLARIYSRSCNALWPRRNVHSKVPKNDVLLSTYGVVPARYNKLHSRSRSSSPRLAARQVRPLPITLSVFHGWWTSLTRQISASSEQHPRCSYPFLHPTSYSPLPRYSRSSCHSESVSVSQSLPMSVGKSSNSNYSYPSEPRSGWF